MGAITKKLTDISFVTDTDQPYYEIGEPQAMFQEHSLEDYIRNYGHEKLSAQLGFLQFQIWQAVRKINREDKESLDLTKAVQKDQ